MSYHIEQCWILYVDDDQCGIYGTREGAEEEFRVIVAEAAETVERMERQWNSAKKLLRELKDISPVI